MSRPDKQWTYEFNTEASWCEVSTTYGSRLACLGLPDFSGLNQTKIDAERAIQYANDGTMPIRGHKSDSEFSFDYWPAGHGSTTAGAVTREEHELMTGYFLGSSATGGSGGTATGGTANIPTTSGESLIVGQIGWCGVKGDGRGDGQAFVVGTDGAGSLTLLTNLPGAPTNGDVIYGGAHAYVNEAAASVAITSLRGRALTNNQNYAMRGQYPKSWSLAGTNPGEIPRVTATLGVSDWDPTATTLPSATAIDEFNAASCAGGSLFINNVGTATRAVYDARDFAINVALNTIALPGPGGNSALQRDVGAVRGPTMITVSFTLDAQTASATPTWEGLWDSDSQYYHLLWNANGAATGKRLAVYFPRLCIVDKKPVQFSRNGVNSIRVTMQAYTGATTTSELTLSAMRIAFG